MSQKASWDRVSIEKQLKQMMAEASPLGIEDIDNSVKLVELGLSSLQLQILAAQVEAAFDIRFGDSELGTIESFAHMVAAVEQHLRDRP